MQNNLKCLQKGTFDSALIFQKQPELYDPLKKQLYFHFPSLYLLMKHEPPVNEMYNNLRRGKFAFFY